MRTAVCYCSAQGMQLSRGDLALFDPSTGDRSLAEIWFHAQFSDMEEAWTVAVLHPLERSETTFGQFRLIDAGPALVLTRHLVHACVHRRSECGRVVTALWPLTYRQKLQDL